MLKKHPVLIELESTLKEKILFMYENQSRCKEMGEQARKRILSGFTWDNYGDRIISEYKRVKKA